VLWVVEGLIKVAAVLGGTWEDLLQGNTGGPI
jgi:hypothetical protein